VVPKVFLLTVLLSLVSLVCIAQGTAGSSFNVMILPVSDMIPDTLFESLGTRTAQFHYFKLNDDRTHSTTLIIKGWLFAPDESMHEKIDKVFVSGDNYDLRYDVKLERDGAYFRLEPHLFVLPPDVSEMSLFGLQLVLSEEEIVMDFEVIVPGRMPRRFTEGLDIFRIDEDDLLQERRFVAGESALIGIFGGERPTGGYSLRVDSIVRAGDEIRVSAILNAPSRDAFVTQAFTYPAIVIDLPLDIERGDYRIVLDLATVRDGELISRTAHSSEISVSDHQE